MPPSRSKARYIYGVARLCSHKQWGLQALQVLKVAEWGSDSAHGMKDRVVDHRLVVKGLFQGWEGVMQTDDVGSFP